MKILDEYTAVFLADTYPPTKIVLLKRASFKKIFPNLYTGIGGKQEPEDKDIHQTALRELKEETDVRTEITQFAKCIVQGDHARILNFYFGLYNNDVLPECNEGDLEWVFVDKLLDKEIISTTVKVIEEWQKRGFKTEKPWTFVMNETQKDGKIESLEVITLQEKLIT